MQSTLKSILLLIIFVGAGLGAGYAARIGLAKASEPAPVLAGDFSPVIAPHPTPIVLYATKTCPYCQKAREFFQTNQLAFTELDVTDPVVAAQFKALGGNGVPMVFSKQLRIIGFDADAYAKLRAAGQ